MKKFRRILTCSIASVVMFLTPIVALAENGTTLTTTVPAAQYTLNIPADQEITYGKTETNIGDLTVTETSGFAAGKNLVVTIEFEPFSSQTTETKIPFKVKAGNASGPNTDPQDSGLQVTFKGRSNGTVDETFSMVPSINVHVSSEDWGKAYAGTYTTTLTFTADVVIEE